MAGLIACNFMHSACRLCALEISSSDKSGHVISDTRLFHFSCKMLKSWTGLGTRLVHVQTVISMQTIPCCNASHTRFWNHMCFISLSSSLSMTIKGSGHEITCMAAASNSNSSSATVLLYHRCWLLSAYFLLTTWFCVGFTAPC